MVRNTYIYPPAPSMQIIGDIFRYCSAKMPKFNCISISGYHMQEAGATADIELGYTLADGLEYIRTGIAAGLDIDDFAPRLSFFWGIGMNHFMEIAKMRAARVLWAKIIKGFNPKNPKSMALRTHSQTSGWSLTAQDVFNNVPRTCVEALAAVLGHTQSLHTNALDEAIALPTDFSARIARNTQIYLQEETGITKVVDPWAGSYYVESAHPRPDAQGVAPHPGDRSARRHGQGHRDRHSQDAHRRGGGAAAGADRFRPRDHRRRQQVQARPRKKPLDVRDSRQPGGARIAACAGWRRSARTRDQAAVEQALAALTAARAERRRQPARTRRQRGPAARHAGRDLRRAGKGVRALPGGEPHHLRRVLLREPGRSGVPEGARDGARSSPALEGRRPRILVAKMGQDGHDRGAKVIATAFADLGFDVDVGPLFQTPREAARMAVENDVHVLGVSTLAGGHKTLVPEVIAELKKLGREDILVVRRRRHSAAGLRLPVRRRAWPACSGPAR